MSVETPSGKATRRVKATAKAHQGTKATNHGEAVQHPTLKQWLLIGCFVVVEVGKQLSIYGAQYANGGTPPMSASLTVAMTETLKLVIGVILLANQIGPRWRETLYWSGSFAVPAIGYCLCNNLYLLALQHTSPPSWNSLIQLRIVVIAVLSRLVFGRKLRYSQWTGLVLLVGGVLLSQQGTGQALAIDSHTVLLAAIAVGVNAFVSLFMEHTFKSHPASFLHQQVAMYSYGAAVTSAYCLRDWLSATGFDWSPVPLARTLHLLGMALSAASGLAVAAIVKQLDTMAKLFAAALALAVQGLASAWLFPDRFVLTSQFMSAVVMIFVANYLYYRPISKLK